jgi:hypothetical protein
MVVMSIGDDEKQKSRLYMRLLMIEAAMATATRTGAPTAILGVPAI